jgi:hypothetical protein
MSSLNHMHAFSVTVLNLNRTLNPSGSESKIKMKIMIKWGTR